MLGAILALFVAAAPSPAPQPFLGLEYAHVPARAASKRPPLLVLLHGYGTDEHDLVPLAAQLDPRFEVVSFRAPVPLGPGRNAWFSRVSDVQASTPEFEDVRVRVLGAIRAAQQAFGTGRVYVLGFSQGAMLALFLGVTEPGALDGVVVLSGQWLPEAEVRLTPSKALAALGVFESHGTSDAVIPVAKGRAVRDALQPQCRMTYREFDGGHAIPLEIRTAVGSWLRERLDSK
jgi:phospholipase/carboxylesterase